MRGSKGKERKDLEKRYEEEAVVEENEDAQSLEL